MWKGKVRVPISLSKQMDQIHFFRYVELATPPLQQAYYLPNIAGTHLHTRVERSNYGKVFTSRKQHVDRNVARTYNLLFMNPALIR